MSESSGNEQAREARQTEHLLDFLERAQTLFRGKWFVLLTITTGIALALSIFDLVQDWALFADSGIAIATALIVLVLPVINLCTMVSLIRHADDRALNARRRYCKFLFVVAIIGLSLAGILLFAAFFLSGAEVDALGGPPLKQYLLYLLPRVVASIALLAYQSALNGFYKNLYGQTQGLYIARAYARRVRYAYVCAQILQLASPYLMSALSAVLPALASSVDTGAVVLQAISYDVITILSIALTLLNMVATFLFFKEAEPLERSA